jgi:hypothetical protein
VNIIRGANYSDLLKLQVVNEHISKVVQSDPQAWYIFADADEHATSLKRWLSTTASGASSATCDPPTAT